MQTRIILSTLSLVLSSCSTPDDEATVRNTVQLYKTPQCSCCANYVRYLRKHNYTVEVTDLLPSQMEEQRRRLGIPPKLSACHTSIIAGYIVEGHVPVVAIEQLIASKPDAKGISVPGMPAHSPGMGNPNGQSLPVYYLSPDADALFRFEYVEPAFTDGENASLSDVGADPTSLTTTVELSQSHPTKE